MHGCIAPSEVPGISLSEARVFREVAEIRNGVIESEGFKAVEFGGQNLSSGVYYNRLTAKSVDGDGEFTVVKKMILLK